MAMFITMIVASCTTTRNESVASARWLSGTWENRSKSGVMYEAWLKSSEKEFTGSSYMVKGNDTVVMEKMRLVEEDDQIVYIPIVANQNDGLPIRFIAKTVSDSLLVFENLEHDFPQHISYQRISGDSIVAEIWGDRSGREVRQVFPMKRTR